MRAFAVHRRPDGRIDDARILLGRAPADPAGARRAPRCRQRRIVVARAPAPDPSATSRCDPARRRRRKFCTGPPARFAASSSCFDDRAPLRNRACADWSRADRAPSTRARAAGLRHRDRRSDPSASTCTSSVDRRCAAHCDRLAAHHERLGAVADRDSARGSCGSTSTTTRSVQSP